MKPQVKSNPHSIYGYLSVWNVEPPVGIMIPRRQYLKNSLRVSLPSLRSACKSSRKEAADLSGPPSHQ